MWARKALITALAVTSAAASPLSKRQFSYGSSPVRGVNVGGWLVLEPWITPSIFQPFGGSVVDEYTLCQNAGNAESILRSHWDSWVSLGDFQKIADNGFNLVRIPIGYWAFQKYEQDPYIQGAADYLDTAIGWARQTGLKVWIDLHGAPRSQNGYDNSGQLTSTPGWTQGDTVDATLDVIGQIAEKYGTSQYSDVVVGIELLNEPNMPALSGGKPAVQGYYQSGFGIVRQYGQTPVVIHDGFDKPSDWNGFLTGQGTSGAIIDHHEYQCFSNADVALSPEDHVSEVWNSANTWATGQDKFLIVGEWTAAMTDCAPALNGWGIGARYDGTYSKRNADGSYDTAPYVGSCANMNFIDQWSDYYKQATTNYISAQMSAFESKVQGWIFWNFKTEAAAEWDLFRLIDNGVWPQSS
ncbi:glucan exo-1,3-beta-glucosidase [Exophiala xenobiotica]|nr:glucan exo-1,3-beta-glucosidase [Exophiala xenobiotica]